MEMRRSGSNLPSCSTEVNSAGTSSSLTGHKNSLEDNLTKYPLLPPCRCRKHCHNLFSELSRTRIHRFFWSLDHFSRGLWIFNRITNKPVSKLKKPTKSGSNRSCVRAYFMEASLKIDNPEIVNVCQKFFLSTLGYKSDKVITYTLKVFKDVKDHSKLVPKSDDKSSSRGRVITKVGSLKIKSDTTTDGPPTLRPPNIPHSSETHPLLPPCACKQHCIVKICNDERQGIHTKYWSLSYSDRKHWLYSCIKSLPIQRRTSNTGIQRACSRQYFLPLSNGKNICVCQKFFLSTLGYNNDKIIVHTIAALSHPGGVALASSGRKSKNRLSGKIVELMRKHIANNSSDFKKRPVKKLYDDFLTTHPRLKKKPSYESYRLLVVSMNVRDNPKPKSVDNPGEFKGKIELDVDELHYFEDLELYSPNLGLGYPSYLEQLSSSLPVEIPLQFPAESVPSPHQFVDSPESSQSSRQGGRQHQFLVMPGNSLEMGHLVTNDNLIML